MIRAYNELYLAKAQTALAQMLRYAVNDLGYDADGFFEMFMSTMIADAFENGDPRYTVGMSGVEMADEVVFHATGCRVSAEPSWSEEKDPVYWCGWSLGYYQWYSAHTFKDIYSYITPTEVIKMYNPYHEMDILQFVDSLSSFIPAADETTQLAKIRKRSGMSQRVLAYASGVSERMIQYYEQRSKDINKAQADTLSKLSTALGCDMKDLLEKPGVRPMCHTSKSASG